MKNRHDVQIIDNIDHELAITDLRDDIFEETLQKAKKRKYVDNDEEYETTNETIYCDDIEDSEW